MKRKKPDIAALQREIVRLTGIASRQHRVLEAAAQLLEQAEKHSVFMSRRARAWKELAKR